MPELIKVVFDFDWTDIPLMPYGTAGGEYKLSASDVQNILEAPKEVDTYDIISKVSNALLSQVYGYAGSGPDPPHARKQRREIIARRATRLQSGCEVPVRTYRGRVGTRAAVGISEHKLKEKPDMTYGVEETPKLDFKWATVPMEVEKTRELSAGELSDVLVKQEDGIFLVLVCKFASTALHVDTSR